MRCPTLLACSLLLVLHSCGPAEVKSSRSALPAPDSLQRDFGTWYAYTMTHTPLGRPFQARSETGAPMERRAFLEALAGGRYIAVRSGEGAEYRLHPLTATDKNIRTTMRSLARTELAHDARVGKPLPPFAVTDLEGRRYTTENTKGKYLLVKCWFVGCKACVDEFPELNALVAGYAGRNDVQFLSLTLDRKEALEPFLKSFPFRYAVVPDVEAYVTGPLGVEAYPHHLLVSKEGLVLKSTNSLRDLLPVLRAELGKKE